jgi:GT2 family glycosyltransferase
MTSEKTAGDASRVPVNITMVTCNSLAHTRRSIESIIALAGYAYVLTGVDNATTDGTVPFPGAVPSTVRWIRL